MRKLRLFISACMAVGVLNVVGQADNLSQISDYLAKVNQDLKSEDLSGLVVTDSYKSRHNGVTHLYASQSVNGVRVFNVNLSAAIAADGSVKKVFGKLIPNINAKAPTSAPGIDLAGAAGRIASVYAPDLIASTGQMPGEIVFSGPNYSHTTKGELVYWLNPLDELKLSWVFDLDLPSGKHWYQYVVDAQTGQELTKFDWQVSCSSDHIHAASCAIPSMIAKSSETSVEDGSGYNVFSFPIESPSHGSRSIVVEPATASASPFGWHDTDGVPGAEFTITRGNNVYAYDDIDDLNEPGFSPDGGVDLNFDFTLELGSSPETYLSASITNLFYANNRIHDILYEYGFDEPAGNFQQNNYGNGGLGSDWVRAECQDGGGLNNANMATPPDGQRPRMQMYLWQSGTNTSNLLVVNSPSSIEGAYASSLTAAFGPNLPEGGITADLVIAEDNLGSTLLCGDAGNAEELDGKIAVIDRGSCTFVEKVLNAQDAGAVAVIIVNNEFGGVIAMGGTSNEINIPSIMIGLSDGNSIKSVLNGGAEVNATLDPTGANSSFKDGSFDNGIIIHEYVHGLSNRLTGGPSTSFCLGNEEQMGEGWSDWYGIMMTMDLNADNPVYRPIGTFATSEPITGQGIRPAAYDTSFAVNDFTYADVGNGNISVPHGVGFIWSTMLWDLTWALIDEYGFDEDIYTGNGGNNLAMQLVTDGMKLQVCEPGFVDGRDAILLADELNNNGANQCLIWEVFAKRGLGFSADQGSSQSRSDGTAGFDLPPLCMAVTSAPTANFEASTLITCDGNVSFVDLSENVPQEWLWNFGDGNTSTEQNPSHQYQEPGSYQVSLTVSNTLGEDLLVSEDEILFEIPAEAVVSDDVEACVGSTFTLSASSDEGNVAWYNSGEVLVGVGESIELVMGQQPQTYIARSLVDEFPVSFAGPEDNSFGEGNIHSTGFIGTVDIEAFEPLTIVSALVFVETPGVRTVNLYDEISADGDIIQTVDVDIDFVGSGRIYLGFEIDAPGFYSFGLNSAGLYRNNTNVSYPYPDDSGRLSIVGSSAGPDLYYYFYDLEIDEPFCLSTGVEVNASPTGNTNFAYEISELQVSFSGSSSSSGWTWDFGDGNTSTLQNPVHTYAGDGVYTVTLSTDDGCTRTEEITVGDPVSVFDGEEGGGFVMMPNPADNWLRISAGENASAEVELLNFYNISGQLVRSFQLNPGQGEWVINTSEFANGFYMASIHNKDGRSIHREKIMVVR